MRNPKKVETVNIKGINVDIRLVDRIGNLNAKAWPSNKFYPPYLKDRIMNCDKTT